MNFPEAHDTMVQTLGDAEVPSPLRSFRPDGFVDERHRVFLHSQTHEDLAFREQGVVPPSFERAGPRDSLFFDPTQVTCGIVTCGGLCPGLNDVIRSLTLTSIHGYGVPRVLGFRYGYAGLAADGEAPVELSHDEVDHIHEQGGTMLGSSRGPQSDSEIVDTLQKYGVDILFVVGGDGTLRGGADIAAEITRQGLPISVIGVPKTIDNDLQWVSRSFGFTTAVEEARNAIQSAHIEARGALNGVGLVKLMGRHSGFIAAHASMASSDVNFCLVPEIPFSLDGEEGFLKALVNRLEGRRHAVIVVAEGAGQDHVAAEGNQQRDKSGNLKLKDIGVFMRERIEAHLKGIGMEFSMKYIDPSYTIRSLPANAFDSEYCLMLGQHAVHAGMAGRTGMVVGLWNRYFTNIPIELVTRGRQQIDPNGQEWHRVLDSTGQRTFSATSPVQE